MKKLALLGLVAACAAMVLDGATRTWIGMSGGNWNDNANWEGNAVPGASDTAVFALTADARVILKANATAAKIAVTGARLDLYSGTGRTLTLGSSAPELAVGAGAKLRVSGVKLAAAGKVAKTGAGNLTVVARAASAIDLDDQDGELVLEDEFGKEVIVAANDGLWTYDGVTYSGETVKHTPYGGTDGIYAGNTAGSVVTVTARREPIKINGKFRISGDVLMEGTGSWGFSTVIHNDPRGYLARTECQQNAYLGYASSGAGVKGAIQKSFAFGVLNHFEHSDGRVVWGWNGEWKNPANVSGTPTDPLIYTSPCGSNSATDRHERRFKLQLDFDQVQKTAVLTLVQDQSAIVQDGGSEVTWTKTLRGVDLTALCEGDTATLAFTTDAGGRNTVVSISNLKVEYFESDQHVKDVMAVVQSEDLWTNCCYTTEGKESQGLVYGSEEGSVHVGAGSSEKGSVTARKEKVGVTGKFLVSGKVSDAGSGSHGWAFVFHNDSRGLMAHASVQKGTDMVFSGTGKIENSYAVRFLNYYNYRGQVGNGANGVWNAVRNTIIRTNPYDEPNKVLSVAKYDFSALFDGRAKTMVLTLTQEQDGETVTAVETFTDVDVPTLVGGETAWLSLTSDAGGRTTNATIDEFKIEYLAYDDEIVDASFFKSLETSGTHPVILSESGKSDFVADLGALTVDQGTLQFGYAQSSVKVVPSENLWSRVTFTKESPDDKEGSVYGTRDGSVLVGANAGYTASVTARKEEVSVKGRFLISGKVTDSGSGAHGWTLVLHNDPRGYLAHAACMENSNLAFAGSDAIAKSYAFRVMNFYNDRGMVSDGKNGVWNSFRTTAPLIRTNPNDGSGVASTVRYDFSALFDERAKTMTLTLTQEQNGETVTAVETFTDVDVPALVGGESAWLSLTSDSGGRTTNVTIDDFKIDYLVGSDEKMAFACQGVANVADEAELMLCNSSFKVSVGDQLLGFKALRLNGASALDVAEGVAAKLRPLYIDGTKIRRGVFTSEDCDWVTGLGSVELCPYGMAIIVR